MSASENRFEDIPDSETLPLRSDPDFQNDLRRKSRLEKLRNLNATWKICICVVIFVAAILAILVTGLVIVTKSVFDEPIVELRFIDQNCSVALNFCRNCRRNNESCMSRELDNDISNEVIFQTLDVLCAECHEQYSDCPNIREKCNRSSSNVKTYKNNSYCYTEDSCGPKTWGGVCKTGHRQSPIQLPYISHITEQSETSLRSSNVFAMNPDFQKKYQVFFITNNDHTIQIQFTANLTSSCKISGDTLSGSYTFSQIHFHWGSTSGTGSEHGINRKFYNLEIHLVHYSDEYESLKEAFISRDRRALSVLAIFVEISPERNPAFEPILELIALVKHPLEDPLPVEPRLPLNLSAFFPKSLDFYRYQGSLTSPPCSEVVSWLVFRQPVVISEEQLNYFRQTENSHHYSLSDNYRPPQPIAGREVLIQHVVT